MLTLVSAAFLFQQLGECTARGHPPNTSPTPQRARNQHHAQASALLLPQEPPSAFGAAPRRPRVRPRCVPRARYVTDAIILCKWRRGQREGVGDPRRRAGYCRLEFPGLIKGVTTPPRTAHAAPAHPPSRPGRLVWRRPPAPALQRPRRRLGVGVMFSLPIGSRPSFLCYFPSCARAETHFPPRAVRG